ncbi:MAG: T9SS type A sorting domain-containing protein [Bacteroidia bacterium]
MNKLHYLIILMLACRICEGQNLVPNSSFEDTANVFCGVFSVTDFNSSINYWYTPTQGTPDLYSTQINQSCWNFQPNSTYGGPVCLKGSQLPRTGSVFAGLACYSIPGLNQREYIQSPLTNSMVPGNSYYLEFYASLPDHEEKYTNKLGAYFSNSAVTSTNDQPLPYIPQVVATSFISDTATWVKISGVFQATSAFNYITIGNFNDDTTTPTMNNPGGSSAPGCYGAYYFIDDVTVSDITGIKDLNDIFSVNVFPNPFIYRIYAMSYNNDQYDFIIYDTTLRKLLQQRFTNSTTLNTAQLAKGIYLYEIRNKNGVIKKGKVVKE